MLVEETKGKRTTSGHCQKDRKGDNKPSPPVDDPNPVNLRPVGLMISPTRRVEWRFIPYHQTITENHIGAIERLVGKVQRDGLAVEVTLWGVWSPIEETLLK